MFCCVVVVVFGKASSTRQKTGACAGALNAAAASHIPQPLIEQLKPGGRLVIPVGLPYSYQELMLITKDAHGGTHSRSVLGVAFVPLIEEKPLGREGETVH